MRRRLVARYVLEGIVKQLDSCVRYGMQCRNPPALTTGLLHSLGLSDYEVRSFWRGVKDCIKRGIGSITLLKHRGVEFRAELEFRSGAVCYIDRNAYADIHDCDPRSGDVRILTNSNKVYVFVKGYLGSEAFIKVNAIYLLKKLVDLGEADTAAMLLDIARRVVGGSAQDMELWAMVSAIKPLLKFSKELSELMVYIPKNINEMLTYIPVLRYVMRARPPLSR